MFISSVTLSLLLVIVSGANAKPIRRDSNGVTLSLASKINAISGAQNLADLDRSRASALLENLSAKKNGKRADYPVPLTNAIVTYTASVGVGSPPTQCEHGIYLIAA